MTPDKPFDFHAFILGARAVTRASRTPVEFVKFEPRCPKAPLLVFNPNSCCFDTYQTDGKFDTNSTLGGSALDLVMEA